MTTALLRAVELCGSQRELADAIGVSAQTVWAWIARSTLIPADKCPAIEQATNGAVTRQDPRPDDWRLIWPELAQREAA